MVMTPSKIPLFLRNPERSPSKNLKNLPTQHSSFFYKKFPSPMLFFLSKSYKPLKWLRSTTINDGSFFKTIPLRKTRKIAHGNGLKRGEKIVHTILTTIKTHFFNFQKMKSPCKFKKSINTLSRAYHPKTGKRNHQIRITMTHAFWPLFLTSIFCVVRENQWKMKTTQTQIRIFYNRRFLHGGSGGSFSKNVAWLLQCSWIIT